ncbi:MAG: ADP-ribosylglycohydrolase family protein [Acidobacteria bacterium]|nr:ADP-ribosylglycohydrolase family protein [Acidobacteriota bacterium]
MDPKELTSRFIGTIAGFAIGDALGMPTQFLTRDQIRRYYGKAITGFRKAHPGHASDFLPEGSYTDDTQMMLATAECLVEFRRMDPARQAEALLSWYLNTMPHRTPMRANIRACRHLSAGRSWTKSGVFSGGCGAAVRMPPVGLFFYRCPEALVRAALDDCMITHTDPRARASSVAVAYLVARLVQANERSSPGEQVLEAADKVSSVDQDVAAMLRWVTQICHLAPEEALFEIGTSSDAIEAIPAAVYCFLKHPRQFSQAVLPAVNAGDASDSIAALAGSFVGAYAGLGAIPQQWVQEVENRDVLEGVAENLAALACTKNASEPVVNVTSNRQPGWKTQ